MLCSYYTTFPAACQEEKEVPSPRGGVAMALKENKKGKKWQNLQPPIT